MPSRFGLGSAEFELVVTNDQLLQGFAQSQAQARLGSRKIADAINQEMARISPKPIVPVLDLKPAQRQVSQLQQLLQGAARGGLAGSGLGSGLAIGAGFGAASAAAVGVAALTKALVGGTAAGIEYNAQLQTTLNTFAFFSKSADDAARAVSELRKLATISPFGEQPILQAGATFLRVSQGDVDRALELTKLTTVLAAAHPEVGFEAMQAAISQLISGDFRAFEDRTNIAFGTVEGLAKKGVTGMELYRQAVLAAGGSMELLKLNASGVTAAQTTLDAEIARFQGLATKGISDRLPSGLAALTAGLKEAEPAAQFFSEVLGTMADNAGRTAEAIAFLASAPGKLEGAIRSFSGAAPRGQTRGGQGRSAAAAEAPPPETPAPESDIDRKSRLQREGDEALKEAHRVFAERSKIINQQIVEAEAARKDQLAKADRDEKAEIKAINDNHARRLAANKAAIDDAERARDAEITAARAKHQAIVRELEGEVAAVQAARQAEDRALADTRGGQDRQLQDQRSFVDRVLTDRRAQEDRAFADEREAALSSLKAQEEARQRSVANEIKAIEARTQAAIRGLDDEAEAARTDAASAIRGIEDQSRADADRHRKRMANLDAEQARELGAVDKQLKALDTVERKQAEAEQSTKLAADKSRAERGLGAALRVGNPAGIAAARKALADAEAAIQKESGQRERDAQRRKLQAQADDIRKEFDAKKRALDNEERARQEAANREKQRIQDGLAASLAAIADRKQAVQDAAKDEIQTVRDNDQVARDANAAAVQRVTDEFDARQQARDADRLEQDRALADGRLAQDRDLAERRQTEDRALADGRLAQDEDLRLRRQAADDALANEQIAIDETYNGKTGILTVLRKATDDINAEHKKQLDDVEEKYNGPDGIKTKINATWDSAVAGLVAAREHLQAELEQQVKDWEKWRGGTTAEIQKVIDKINDLINKIKEIPGAEGGPNVAVNGGGQALPGGGGNLAYGPVIRNASADSYWTSGGTHGGHPAADIFAPSGSPIYSPVDGQLSSYHVPAGGNAATLTGADGRAYYFAHGKVPFESGGVKRGQVIGQVGNSGNAEFTASHLHFAISEHGAGVFSDFNGSGDVTGDASYWGDGGVGVGHGDGDWIDVTLFGKKYRILVANSKVPGEVGQAIRQALSADNLPRDWELPLGEIAAVESGSRRPDGSAVVGTGDFKAFNGVLGASGLMQVIPGTFRAYRNLELPDDIFGHVANPAAAARYIERRYKTPWQTDYFSSGHMDWRGVPGYAEGSGWISRPTLLQDYQTGDYVGVMSEAGPERIVPQGGAGDGRPLLLQVNMDGRKAAEVLDPHLRVIQTHDRTLRRR